MTPRKEICQEIASYYMSIMEEVNPHVKYLDIIAIDRVQRLTKALSLEDLKQVALLEQQYYDNNEYKKMMFNLQQMFFW